MDWESYRVQIAGGLDGSCDLPMCYNCKHWKAESSLGQNFFGECSRAGSDSGKPDDAGSLAFAEDCEAYGAELNTKPDFSCIQWEPLARNGG